MGARSARAGAPASASKRRPAAGIAAAIRAYLARRFIYRRWYPEIREVAVREQAAIVSSWHLGGAGAGPTARRICTAVLASHQVRRARVKYGRGAIACP